MCGSESGGGSLVLRLPSESIYVSGEMQRGRERLVGWRSLRRSILICCPSF